MDLTDEQIAALEAQSQQGGSAPPSHEESLSDEQMAALESGATEKKTDHGPLGKFVDMMLGHGASDNIMNASKKIKEMATSPDDASPTPTLSKLDKINTALNQIPDEGEPSTRVENVYESTKNLPTPVQNIAATAMAARDYMGESHGVLGQIGNVLTIPEQLLMRQAATVASQVGAMPPEDAKKLLSQNSFMFSDLLNYYWKEPSNVGYRSARLALGIAGNILFDPLSVVAGLGKLTNATKQVQILGKTADLTKASDSEVAVAKVASKVGNIITADGQFTNLDNVDAVRSFSKGEIGFNEMTQTLQASPEALAEVKFAGEALAKPQGYFEGLASGDRGPVVGLGIPFTNIYKEYDAPFLQHITKPMGKTVMAFIEGMSKADDKLGNLPSKVVNSLSQLKTKTGIPGWDAAVNGFRGETSDINLQNNVIGQKAYMMMKGASPEEAAGALNVLEMETQDPMAVLQRFGKQAVAADGTVSPELLKLHGNNARAAEIRAGMPDNVNEYVDFHRKVSDEVMSMKEKLGLGDELDPFRGGPQGATNYVAHVVSKDFLEANKDFRSSILAGQEAINLRLGRNVDRSSLGRSYTGIISDANKVTEEAMNAPKFVNDPVQLLQHTYINGRKAARNYKLMQGALDYSKIYSDYDVRGAMSLQKAADLGDMEAAAKLGDAMESIRVPEDWVKWNPEDYKELYAPIGEGGEFAKNTDGQVMVAQRAMSFLPKEYNVPGNNIYMPPQIASQLKELINPYHDMGDAKRILDRVGNATNFLKSIYLNSRSMVGLTAVARTSDFLANGPYTPFKSLLGAMKMWEPPAFIKTGLNFAEKAAKDLEEEKIMFEFPKTHVAPLGESLTRQDMVEELRKMNVINSYDSAPVQWGDATDQLARIRDFNKEMGTIPKTALEFATLYRTSQYLVKTEDDFFKSAFYLDRRYAGFTPQAAADATERVFFNFNNQNRGAIPQALRTAWIFSSHPIKALEGAIHSLAQGPLAKISIPEKVTHTLEGLYIQDPDVRQAIQQQLPMYDQVKDVVLGPLLPGQRQVLLDIPWSNGTMSFFADPQKNINPLINMMLPIFTSKSVTRFDGDVAQNKYLKDFTNQVDQLLPWSAKYGLAIAEVNGLFGDTSSIMPGGFFGNMISPPVGATPGGSKYFRDSVDFGKYMEEQMGGNWLYRMFFKPLRGELLGEEQQIAARGNFMYHNFRNDSMGMGLITNSDSDMHRTDEAFKKSQESWMYARKRETRAIDTQEEMAIKSRWDGLMDGTTHMQAMDRNFLVNMGAMNRQYEDLTDKMKKQISDQGLLPDAKAIDDWEKLQEIARVNPIAAKVVSLRREQQALHNFYSWWINANRDAHEATGVPGYNPFKLLFGLDHVQFDDEARDDRKDLKELEPALNPSRTYFNTLQDMNKESLQ